MYFAFQRTQYMHYCITSCLHKHVHGHTTGIVETDQSASQFVERLLLCRQIGQEGGSKTLLSSLKHL